MPRTTSRTRYRRSAVGLGLALAGCADVFGGGPKIAVSLRLVQPAIQTPLALDVDASGRHVRVASGADGVTVHGDGYGDHTVRVTLRTAAGDSLAAATFTQHFERDGDHWIAGIVGRQRPVGVCVGTLVVAPLRTGNGDSLFVAYGGIPEGAIC